MNSMPAPPSKAQHEGYRAIEIPRFVQYTTPILPQNDTPSPTANLPLNILALIISFLDDVADVSRVTRTSRLLYYMTLPQLYENVTLTSHAEIRYINGRPEGFGGGSPFTMALNGLATKNNVSLIKRFRVRGKWNEPGDEEYGKGRIPDSTVMLNTLLRISVDRMARVQSFIWDLATKPLMTLYQGLSVRDTLTSLTLRFPNSRIPRPVTTIPPMPNLRSFKALDIDPLCYPDDISLLIYGSRNLLDLRLHFSPRMRQMAELTLSIDMFFGRCFRAKYAPKLEHIAMQNFFGRQMDMMAYMVDNDTCKSITFLDVFGGARTSSTTVFVDDSWRNIPDDLVNTARTIRFNEPAKQHVKMLEGATTLLEHFYCVNDHPRSASRVGTPATAPTPDPSPADITHTNPELIALGKDYLHVLTRKHGSTLKHMLMCDQWALSQQEIGDVVRMCPNLTQLAVALDGPAFEVFRIIVQFLQNLTAIRIFDNDTFRRTHEEMTFEERVLFMGRDFYRLNMHNIQYVGAGNEIFKLGGNKEIINADGTMETVRDLILVKPEDVSHVEIFAMDKFDIMLESTILTRPG